jgi:hypothetical protein
MVNNRFMTAKKESLFPRTPNVRSTRGLQPRIGNRNRHSITVTKFSISNPQIFGVKSWNFTLLEEVCYEVSRIANILRKVVDLVDLKRTLKTAPKNSDGRRRYSDFSKFSGPRNQLITKFPQNEQSHFPLQPKVRSTRGLLHRMRNLNRQSTTVTEFSISAVEISAVKSWNFTLLEEVC